MSGQQLLEQAQQLLAILRGQARRAFVIELTGTPKAGKSTSVTILRTFFAQAGYQVHLLKERAADCPLPMKGHFFFNAWTTATMLAEVLATQETSVDVLLLDRGFFDALVWLELQARRDQVSADETRVFADFVLLERWRSLVDVTVIMKVTPDVALRREHDGQIVPRVGGMMNPSALAQFNEALDEVARKYRERFSLITIDTTPSRRVVDTNITLLRELLPRIEAWADPQIAVVSRAAVVALFGERPFIFGEDAKKALSELAGQVTFARRSDAERDSNLVQFIAAGVHTYKDRILILERESREKDKKAKDYGRRTLWIGCHVDSRGEVLAAAIECLDRRIQQDLHLWTRPTVDFLGLAWDQSQPETQHLGVMFRAPVSSDHVAEHLKDKQFKKMGRAGRLKSLFMTQEEIVTGLDDLDLEPWSRYMVRNIKLTVIDKDVTP